MVSCNKCTRTFSTKSSLARHTSSRQSPCREPTHHCTTCGKALLSYQTLWKHRKRCHAKADVEISRHAKSVTTGDGEVLPIGTLNKIVNKPQAHASTNLAKDGEKNDDTSPPPPKRVKQDDDDNRPNIIDCMDCITPISDDANTLSNDDHDDDNDTSESYVNEHKEAAECYDEQDDQPHINKVLSEFIESMITIPRKSLMELLRSLKNKGAKDDENVVRLEQLIDEFLRGNMKVNEEMEKVVNTLKTTATTVEINNLLNEIEDVNHRFRYIFHRLNNAKHDDISDILKTLRREQQISEKAYEKLSEDANSLPSIIAVLKVHPYRRDDAIRSGNGIVYLPGTIQGLQNKLLLLLAEYHAGNTTTCSEVISILDRLRERDAL